MVKFPMEGPSELSRLNIDDLIEPLDNKLKKPSHNTYDDLSKRAVKN